MSLQLVESANPALTYLECPEPLPPSAIFNLELCTPPRHYQETLVGIEGFYYDISRDVYVMVGLMDQIFFPSWKYTRFDFSPVTGLQVSRQDFGGGAIGFSWTGGYQASDWKKVYAHRIFNPNNYIVEVRPTIPEPTQNQLDNPVVTNSDVDGKAMNFYALNRELNLIAFSNGITPILERYDYSTGTNLGGMKLPEDSVSDIASESNELMWVLQRDSNGSAGLSVSKLNFVNKQFQLYSKVTSGTPGVDQSAGIAFDKLRKSVAIFRRRDDLPDGTAQHVVDIYKPIVSPEILTDPVPVTALDPNGRTTLVAHLMDTKGTGGGGKTVKVTNINPNGKLKQPTTSVRGNGTITIPYDTPDRLEDDTITLEVTV